MTKSTKRLIAGAAMAGLFTGVAARAHATTVTDMSKAGISIKTMDESTPGTHSCKGKNDCKGKGGCKSGDNGCKGKNSCKGKGGCAVKATPAPSPKPE